MMRYAAAGTGARRDGTRNSTARSCPLLVTSRNGDAAADGTRNGGQRTPMEEKMRKRNRLKLFRTAAAAVVLSAAMAWSVPAGARFPAEGAVWAVSQENGGSFTIPAQTEEGLPIPETVLGPLHVEGTRLTGEDGRPVQLKGISTHGIAWYPDYINEGAFRQLHDEWGVNVIRLAMYTAEYNGYCTGGDKEYLKNLLLKGVDAAENQGMYVILDWHILSDGNPNTYKEEAKAFFDEMSEKLADRDHVLYEICNEPNGGTSWQQVKDYAAEVIPVIRANDSDAVIIVGTPNWCQYVDQAAADPITGYDNIMYALHFYAATHKEDLRRQMADAIEKGLPVIVSEYGICDASGNGAIDEAEAGEWVRQMDRYGVSYVAWNLSNKSETSAILKSSCSRTGSFADSDLSDSGKWLKNMLTAGGTLGGTTEKAGSPAGTGQAQSGEGASEMERAQSGEEASETESAQNGEKVSRTGSGTSGAGTGPAGAAAESETKETDAFSAAEDRWVVSCGGLSAVLSVVGRWESGGETYTHYTMELTDTSGASREQWSVSIPFSSEFRLTDGWNGDFAAAGRTLTVSSKSYNGKIPPGGGVSDIGFIVACAGGEAIPAQ